MGSASWNNTGITSTVHELERENNKDVTTKMLAGLAGLGYPAGSSDFSEVQERERSQSPLVGMFQLKIQLQLSFLHIHEISSETQRLFSSKSWMSNLSFNRENLFFDKMSRDLQWCSFLGGCTSKSWKNKSKCLVYNLFSLNYTLTALTDCRICHVG